MISHFKAIFVQTFISGMFNVYVSKKWMIYISQLKQMKKKMRLKHLYQISSCGKKGIKDQSTLLENCGLCTLPNKMKYIIYVLYM